MVTTMWSCIVRAYQPVASAFTVVATAGSARRGRSDTVRCHQLWSGSASDCILRNAFSTPPGARPATTGYRRRARGSWSGVVPGAAEQLLLERRARGTRHAVSGGAEDIDVEAAAAVHAAVEATVGILGSGYLRASEHADRMPGLSRRSLDVRAVDRPGQWRQDTAQDLLGVRRRVAAVAARFVDWRAVEVHAATLVTPTGSYLDCRVHLVCAIGARRTNRWPGKAWPSGSPAWPLLGPAGDRTLCPDTVQGDLCELLDDLVAGRAPAALRNEERFQHRHGGNHAYDDPDRQPQVPLRRPSPALGLGGGPLHDVVESSVDDAASASR